MQINIAGHHVDVTPALKTYIESKLKRIERHFDHVVDVHVILAVEKLRSKAEATVHVTGNNMHATAEHDDMYAAIDTLMDKLDGQIRRYKEKATNHHKRSSSLK